MISFDNNRMQDISLSENTLLMEYKQLWQAQDWQGVATFLNNNPELKYKIFDSYNWNRIKNTLNSDNAVEIDYDYRDGDSSLNFDFVDEMSTSIPQEIMADAQSISENSVNFAYSGQWSSGATYSPNVLVTIDDYHLFYCIQQHEASNANKPLTTGGNAYWILCKGFLGELGTEGIQVSSTQPVNLINEDVWIESPVAYSQMSSGFSTAIRNLTSNATEINYILFTIKPPDSYSSSVSVGENDSIYAYWDSVNKIVTVAPTSLSIIKPPSNCNYMFEDSPAKNIFFYNFDTSDVTSMARMFKGCTNLQSIDVSSFNTSNVTVMTYMFSECSNLTYLDLSSFEVPNVFEMLGMFLDCSSLRTIYVGESWDCQVVNPSLPIFGRCFNLVGTGTDGRTWAFNSNYQDARSAVVGTSSTTIPAYLTLKTNQGE